MELEKYASRAELSITALVEDLRNFNQGPRYILWARKETRVYEREIGSQKTIAVTGETKWRTQIHHYRNVKGFGTGLYLHSQATNEASAFVPSVV